MSLDGVVYEVQLFEVETDDITIRDSTEIIWPQLIGEDNQPPIDGILILYDVTNGESVIKIPDVLCELASTPCIMNAASSISIY